MKWPLGKIRNRAEFDAVLASALDDVRKRESVDAKNPVWMQIRVLLEAAATATVNGRSPTKPERDRFRVGLIASRELEPATDVDVYALANKLQDLQYYYQLHLP